MVFCIKTSRTILIKYSILTLKKKISMNNKELREKVIKRYKNGESLKEIYQSLGKVKALFINSLNILYVIEKLTEN